LKWTRRKEEKSVGEVEEALEAERSLIGRVTGRVEDLGEGG
jgi:hypothetical protein